MVHGPFVEAVAQHDRNRLEARQTNVARAILANGESGVMFSVGGRIHVFSDDEIGRFVDHISEVVVGSE